VRGTRKEFKQSEDVSDGLHINISFLGSVEKVSLKKKMKELSVDAEDISLLFCWYPKASRSLVTVKSFIMCSILTVPPLMPKSIFTHSKNKPPFWGMLYLF